MHKQLNILFILLALVISLGIFSSCATSKKASSGEIKPMTAGKIIRKVADETPKYKNYESKKITVNYQDIKNKSSFSGQFKIDRDECIILTLKKLNFPLGKGMITPDSIHFVNYIDRYFVKGEISALQNLIGVEVDYDLIQALLTADVSKLLQNKEFDKELISNIDENMYRIDSQFNPKIDRALTSGNEKRLNRYMQRMDDSEFIDYNVWVDPVFFVIRKLTFNDIKYKETLTILYNEYEVVGRSLFPQQISFSMQTPKQNLELMIRLTRPTVNKSNDFTFSIPEKYDELKLLNE
ncbi:MAG: DUF4292 domain-containing protein [Prolixibacteraceae bacterium]|nr:DUF4292 domain-containing protein [Prolixibacteraceae bacterium]